MMGEVMDLTLSNRQRSMMILLMAWLAYIISYLGRTNYGSCLLEIVQQTGIRRSAAGMVASAFSVCYAIGQVGSGILLKRFSPVKVIGVELFTAASINLLFPFSGNIGWMMLLWGINGCIQSTVLCGLTQLFVENLEEPYLSKSAVVINTVGAAGGVLNYVLTWALLKYARWEAVFLLAATLLFVFGASWVLLLPKLTVKKERSALEKKTEKPASEPFSAMFSRILRSALENGGIFAIAGCFFIGLLREGISIWIPSYVSDTFQTGTAFSVIVTVVVPLFQILGAFMAGRIGGRFHRLHFPAGILFLISGICMMLLPLMKDFWLPGTLSAFAVNAICMTAALTLYISLFPLRFFEKRDTVTVVGISNFCCHMGSFCASAGVGWISENGGWLTTFGALAALAVLAAAMSLAGGIQGRRGNRRYVKNGMAG